MPDPIQPVGAMIQPPNPNQGIQALSGILGIQQQGQQLQLGQQQIAAGAANTQQAQQRNQELSGLQQFAQNALKDPKYLNSDGTLNTTKFQQDATAIAPVYGPSMIGQITQNATGAIENRKALLGLSNEQRQTAGNYMGAVAQDPNASSESFLDAMDKARDVSDDPGYRRAIDRAIMGAPKDAQGLRNYARTLAVATGAPSAALTTPQKEIYNAPGNRLGVLQTNPLSPMGIGPVGGTTQGLAPAQQPGYLAQAAAASTTGGASAQNDEQLYNQVVQGATRVGQIKSLSGEVQQLAQEVKTGKYSKEGAQLWTALAQRIPGFSNVELTEATRRQLLGKYTQQLMLQAEQANGASTDAAQAHVQAAMPDPDHMTPDAIVDAARYVSGQADVAGTRAKLAMAHRNSQGNSQGLRDIDTRFMSQADPRSYVYQGLPAGEQRRQYLRDHPDFKNQLLLKLHQ